MFAVVAAVRLMLGTLDGVGSGHVMLAGIERAVDGLCGDAMGIPGGPLGDSDRVRLFDRWCPFLVLRSMRLGPAA